MSSTPVRLHGTVVSGGVALPDAAVVLDGGRIAYAGPAAELPAHLRGLPVADLGSGPAEGSGSGSAGLTLLPGLVDIHCHGGGGGEFGADAESATRAAEFHHRAGTTTLLGSLASLAPEGTVAATRTLAGLVADGLLAGIHLEGPFPSTIRCGAQNPAVLTDVDPDLVRAVAGAARKAGGRILQMTYAPERDPDGALPDLLADVGAVAALGHTDSHVGLAAAALARARGAAPSGRRPLVTHLFNGMPPLHHRSPGPVGAALAAAAAGEAVVEVIGDGVHLAPETVRLLFATVGAANIALVTDAMAAAGMPDGSFRLGGLDVTVRDGTARLTHGDSIAGGTATLLDVVRHTVAAGVPLVDAVTAATTTPADALGLPTGRLEAGAHADVLIVNADLGPVAVYRGGVRLTLAG